MAVNFEKLVNIDLLSRFLNKIKALIPSKVSDLTNDSGFVNTTGAANAAPVQSVNGQTGTVVLDTVYTGSTAPDSSTTNLWVDTSTTAYLNLDYNDLTNQPQINGITLTGNKTAANLLLTASNIGAVAVAQGVSHAGEFVVVGSDGNITTVTMTAWAGGNY